MGVPAWAERVEQCADLVAELRRVPHGMFTVDGISVATPDPGGLDVAGLDELGEDSLARAFGDADPLGHVTQTNVGVLRQAKENLRVVREERPAGRGIRT